MSEQTTEPVKTKGMDPRIITVWVLVAFMLGGILVTYNYLLRNRLEAHSSRPAMLGRLERDLDAVNRTGEEVKLGDLKGKVWVAAYLFTDCPKQCIGVAAKMAQLQEKFGENVNFHLVSFSVNPNGDTPEKMDAFVRAHGIDSENWWFLTGDEAIMRDYMLKYFRFFQVVPNTDPATIATQGAFQHDPRLAIVDGLANIRGYYDVTNSQTGKDAEKRLLRDLKIILAEEEARKGGASDEN